jgi:DNA polymerase-3 subunit alpha
LRGPTPTEVNALFKDEALIGNTGVKVQASDELLQAVDRLFGMKVVELG